MTVQILFFVILLGLFFIPVFAQEQIQYTNTATHTFDGFKITLETDKKIYYEGDLVKIHTNVENVLGKDLNYNVYGCGPALFIDQYDFWHIEPTIQGIVCTAEIRTYSLNASGSLEWEYSWNQQVDVGNSWKRITDGIHEITYRFDDYGISLEIKNTSGVKPPLKQWREGIEPLDIQCKVGLELIFKKSINSPYCVKPESIAKLVERGWARA